MSVTPRAHTDCISNPILPLLSKHSQKIRFSTCIPILPLSFPSNPFLLLFFPSSHFPFLPTLSSYSTLLTTPSFYSPSHPFLLQYTLLPTLSYTILLPVLPLSFPSNPFLLQYSLFIHGLEEEEAGKARIQFYRRYFANHLTFHLGCKNRHLCKGYFCNLLIIKKSAKSYVFFRLLLRTLA